MVKVIPVTSELISSEIPNIMRYIHTAFGTDEVELYFVLDNQQNGVLVKKDHRILFLNDKNGKIESFLFDIDDNYELDGYSIADYDVILVKDSVIFSYPNGDEARLSLVKKNKVDFEGYDGVISYQYYREKDDTLLELQYQQMYYGNNTNRAPIHEMHTQIVDGVFITRNASKYTSDNRGFLGKDFDYYSKFEFDRGMLGYVVAMITQTGLINTIMNYDIQSEVNAKIVGYSRCVYINKDGTYTASWPFVAMRDGEEVEEIVRKNGFSLEIPRLMMDVYNDRDSILDKVKECLKQIIEVDKEKEDTHKLKLKLYEDDN